MLESKAPYLVSNFGHPIVVASVGIHKSSLKPPVTKVNNIEKTPTRISVLLPGAKKKKDDLSIGYNNLRDDDTFRLFTSLISRSRNEKKISLLFTKTNMHKLVILCLYSGYQYEY